jgi:hypothetical protein
LFCYKSSLSETVSDLQIQPSIVYAVPQLLFTILLFADPIDAGDSFPGVKVTGTSA